MQMDKLIVGTVLLAVTKSLIDITKNRKYTVSDVTNMSFELIDDSGTNQWFPTDTLGEYFTTDTQSIVAYSTDELSPITEVEKNLVMAILALHRGQPLEADGCPMGKGKTISINKTYLRHYEPIVIPWGFINADVVVLYIDSDGSVWLTNDNDGEDLQFPINITITAGMQLPQIVHRPGVQDTEV